MRTSFRGRAALAAILLLASPSLSEARRHRSHHDQAGSEAGAQVGAFDYYLLSLSIAPSFCALSPANQAKTECRTLTDAAYRQTPLTVHGLWPNLAAVSVNRQPQHCPGPPLDGLPDDLQARLRLYMPGGAGLARHEWERHGTCSGLSPEAYFGSLVRLAQSVNGTIGSTLRDDGLLGQEVGIGDLVARIAGGNPALARAMVVSCSFPRRGSGSGGTGGGNAANGRALIEEIRITLSKEFTPIPAESVGLRQNSGCPQGAGFLPA